MPRSVAADVGGTFTDCLALTEHGIAVAKIPTTGDQSVGVMKGAEALAGGGSFSRLIHGSTVATNALLERKGADVALITDPGFEDVIEIGRQERPSLYDSFADRPTPLVDRDSRYGAGDLASLAETMAARSPEAIAVSLAYSFTDPSAEEAIATALGGLGSPISLSSRVAAEFREFERTSTTVLNAYLWPVVSGYLTHLADGVGAVAERLQVMRSSGGLMEARQAVSLSAALLLSGPAGGVVAAAALAEAKGYGRAISFDMGGTSTDVCRIEQGRAEVGYERTIAGFVCRLPSVAVHTVGAGGGSIGWIDAGGSLRVGPQSAGADPGPASYGHGGTDATVTDAHLLLGRIDPSVPLGGALKLDVTLAAEAVATLGSRLGLHPTAVAEGLLEVVDARMERAIRAVSVEQGADPRAATLVAFGGAGGLHASSLGRRLGMASAVIPPYAGVFSALGLVMAPPRHDGARSVSLGEGADERLTEQVANLVAHVSKAFAHSHGRRPSSVEALVDMRYLGQAHEISVPLRLGGGLVEAEARFHDLHHDVNGFARRGDPVETVTVRAVAQGSPLLGWSDLPQLEEGPLPTSTRRPMAVDGTVHKAAVWKRSQLPAGATLSGPAVITEEMGTTILLPGDVAQVDGDGTIEIRW
ncbi:MAG TPA: hydantoinase/oxoprolinase family protein [Acidimicrobiia bacterium]|nr:hydantoinase/oxoprolinase family protein [Acidimicrobiia bacterium]